MPSKNWPMTVTLVDVNVITDGMIPSMRGKDDGRTCNLVDACAALRVGGEQLPIDTTTSAGVDMYEVIRGIKSWNTLTTGATEGGKKTLEESEMLIPLMYRHKFS